MFFITAMEQMIMAGAFAQWYFTMDKNELAKAPLLRSVQRFVICTLLQRHQQRLNIVSS